MALRCSVLGVLFFGIGLLGGCGKDTISTECDGSTPDLTGEDERDGVGQTDVLDYDRDDDRDDQQLDQQNGLRHRRLR